MEDKSHSAAESILLGNAPPPPAGKHRKKILIGGIIGLVVLGAVIFYYHFFLAPFVSTDDAFIDGYVTMISPRVPGQVSRRARCWTKCPPRNPFP
jgi:multidrug resistance efflux pump